MFYRRKDGRREKSFFRTTGVRRSYGKMKERVKEEKNSREGGGAPPLSTGHDLSLEKGGFFG
ncbi:MAG: hypothetical protein IIZ39_14300, partial [Blautia sp.]|nr:hypothetical protein [Blautia sp.]